MEDYKNWWKKHVEFKSDKIIKMIEDSPEKFMISRTEILQLVLDFKTLKRKFINLAHWQVGQDEWISLPEEEKKKQKEEFAEAEKLIREVFDNYEPPEVD